MSGGLILKDAWDRCPQLPLIGFDDSFPETKSMRLQKYLSDLGVCSRNQAETFIRAGKVSINGKRATLGDKVSDKDVVTVDGKKLQAGARPKKKVVIFCKPRGVECTLSAMKGVRTLLDFDFGPDRIFPIGRLDRESHGLLLLTNDGELGNRLAHPTQEYEEEYLVVVEEDLTAEAVAGFAKGIQSDNTTIVPHQVEQLGDNVLRCVLHEGRSRHLRKLCDAVGLHIIDFQRIRMGTMTLGDLQPGEWRVLSDVEYLSLCPGGNVPRQRRRIVAARRK